MFVVKQFISEEHFIIALVTLGTPLWQKSRSSFIVYLLKTYVCHATIRPFTLVVTFRPMESTSTSNTMLHIASDKHLYNNLHKLQKK